MNDDEFYTALLSKVMSRGWRPDGNNQYGISWRYQNGVLETKCSIFVHDEIEQKLNYYPIEQILFSHSFAEALWGAKWTPEEYYDIDLDLPTNDLFRWQYYLQQLAIVPNRKLFLSIFL